MSQLRGVGVVAVARVERLRQEKQVANQVPVLTEVVGMLELVRMILGVIGPNVLDLVADSPVIGELKVARGLARLDTDVVGDAGN